MDSIQEILAKVEAMEIVNEENRRDAKKTLRRCDKFAEEMATIRTALSGSLTLTREERR